MITIWMTYLLAAAAASGLFIAAGWRSKRDRGPAEQRGWQGVPVDHLWGDAELDLSASETQTDVGAALRLVLKRLSPVMATHAVTADVASSAGLLVRMNSAALTDLLEDLIGAATHSAPASRLLIAATRHGDRVYISVTDDMPGADPALRQGSLRTLMERVAMRGGVLDIAVRPQDGTSLTLRLAAVADRDRVAPEQAATGMADVSSRFSVRAEQ